ncbi:hypothetical protein BGZ83_008141 [Gryganskiella cystojenkinii]|nr:hypothetical protein BGZ83_008141 [Gryganskiella cystojenkinii]
MFMKAILVVAALAAPALAYEPVTCNANASLPIVTSITSDKQFCTMLTGYGVYPVAPNEGCAGVYCYGYKGTTTPNKGLQMPDNYILSVNYVQTANYTQVTGCIDSSVWGQNATDQGGQMDSHGWPYSCAPGPDGRKFNKFLSLLEPATNTFCLRCCRDDNNIDCDTSHSTKGCWNLVPGLYQMADGSACKPPVGAPAVSPTVPPTGVSGAPSATVPGTQPTSGAGGSGSGSGSGTTPLPPAAGKGNAGARTFSSYEFIGAAAAFAVAVVTTL